MWSGLRSVKRVLRVYLGTHLFLENYFSFPWRKEEMMAGTSAHKIQEKMHQFLIFKWRHVQKLGIKGE